MHDYMNNEWMTDSSSLCPPGRRRKHVREERSDQVHLSVLISKYLIVLFLLSLLILSITLFYFHFISIPDL